MQTRSETQAFDFAQLPRFRDDVSRGLEPWLRSTNIDVLIGIPFRDEDDTLPGIVNTALRGIESLGPRTRGAVLLVGTAQSDKALEKAVAVAEGEDAEKVHGFLLASELDGRGWNTRALMFAANYLKIPLIVLAPNLKTQEEVHDTKGEGFGPHWFEKLYRPIRHRGFDLALARFNRDPLSRPVATYLVAPVLRAAYGVHIPQCMSGVFALSVRLMRKCLDAPQSWSKETGTHGVDIWIACRALTEESTICEVPLGLGQFMHEEGILKNVFKEAAHVLFQQIANDDTWRRNVQDGFWYPKSCGVEPDVDAPIFELSPETLRNRITLEFDHFDETLFPVLINSELRKRFEDSVHSDAEPPLLGHREWAGVLKDFIEAYVFNTSFHPDDVVDGLYPFFLAELMSVARQTEALRGALEAARDLPPHRVRHLILDNADRNADRIGYRLVEAWPDLQKAWQERETKRGAYLPRLCTWEFIPHVGVTVPQVVTSTDGVDVEASAVYKKLLDTQRDQFVRFASRIGISTSSDSRIVLDKIGERVRELENILSETLVTQDLSQTKEVGSLARSIAEMFAPIDALQLSDVATWELLQRVPPRQLVTYLHARDVSELLREHAPKDVLAMASWTDGGSYFDRVLDIIRSDGDFDWFERGPAEVLVIEPDKLNQLDEPHGTGLLTRLAGRIVLSTVPKGRGEGMPKLWMLLGLLKRIAGTEQISRVWELCIEDRRNAAARVVDCIRGEWGRHVVSAHNIFENLQQRRVASRLVELSRELREKSKTEALAERLREAADVYHLSITMPDTTFVPLSIWTWASYSRRGGVGAPTPLSSLVERDWATHDFIADYLTLAGLGGAEQVDRTVIDLIADGKGNVDIAQELLGKAPDWDDYSYFETPPTQQPAAGKLERISTRPVLEPIAKNSWESRYVLNAGAIRLDGKIYILYRAFGKDKISRVGLAWTKDGYNIEGRLPEPIFGPEDAAESNGCEDPRITLIDGRLYMLYTAWDGKTPQIALASISADDFLSHRFDAWHRHGLGFPGMANKDAVLYPETFNGKYVLYHRIDPAMWVSFLDNLDTPWPRVGQKTFVAPRPGMMWDSLKIGAGAQPIKTKYGWLNIYHGVDYDKWYRLGVLMMDLDNPAKVIYRSPNPVLSPETEFEVGEERGSDFWVPHVVFTCGAVPATDKDALDIDDEIFVYYGAADTSIGVAKATIGQLVPTLTGDKLARVQPNPVR